MEQTNPFREEWKWITPEEAKRLLATQTVNRPINRKNVERIKHDLISGNYRVTHEGIAIDEDGALIDGGHRLTAAVEAKKSIYLRITYGLPRASMVGVNIGKPRTHADQFAVIGRDETGRHASIATMMMFGAGYVTKVSTPEMIKFIDAHKAAINFAVEVSSGIKYASGPIGGAIARAYYHTDEETLRQFMYSFKTGIVNYRRDEIPVKLRIKVAEFREYGATGRSKLYKLAESALYAYIKNKRLVQIKPHQKEMFKLPLFFE